jgi:hypothetical protein
MEEFSTIETPMSMTRRVEELETSSEARGGDVLGGLVVVFVFP